MKSILVPFDGSPAAEAALQTAITLAKQHNSYLEGLFIKLLPPIIAGEGITLPGDYITQMVEDGQRQADTASASFNQHLTSHGSHLDTNWKSVEGNSAQVVGERGRVFDLIVVGRDTNNPNSDWRVLCEAALFESGRPVLVAPAAVSSRIGKKILLVWNGSTETARTIAMVMPLLKCAEQVRVLTVQGGSVPGPEHDDVVAYLARHGISADSLLIEAAQTGGSTGIACVNHAQEWQADLMVKGAFTQSRFRQFIFGGATSDILVKSTVPVVFCH